jgi:putative nucleotidyltransferase with HDIG domain
VAEPPAEPQDPIDAIAASLGVDLQAVMATDRALTPEEAAVAEAVLAHFDEHRPGPASFPAISLRVLELVRSPDTSAGDLAKEIVQDPALSAAVLVLANSPVFRGYTQIQTVKDAVARLGVQEVARMAAALSTRSLYRAEVRAEFEIFGPVWNRLFYHSATVARVATLHAQKERRARPDQVYVAGMLHDVGKSIALRSLAALAFEGKVTLADGRGIDRVLHRVHVEIGGEVHSEWGLPEHLTAVAVHHHEPEIAPGPFAPELHLVRLTSALHLLRPDPTLHPDAFAEIVDSAQALGYGPGQVAALADELVETEDWVRMVFGEDAGGPARAV